MSDIIIAYFLILGTFFIVVAAIGIVRMPDVYIRMHALAKAATIGIGLLTAAVAVYFNDVTITSLVIGINIFLLMTAPIATHILGKVVIEQGYKMWQRDTKPIEKNSTKKKPLKK